MAASSGPLNSELFANQLAAFGSPQLDPYSFLKAKALNVARSKDTDYAAAFKPSAGYSTLPETSEPGRGPTTEFGSPTPGDDLERRRLDLAFNREALKDYFDLTRQQNLIGIQDMYGPLSQAAEDAAARNYKYSLAYALQKQQFPTTVQDIASSKQMQKYYAGATANDALRAMAEAYRSAAAGSGINYRGTTFSVG